MEECNFNKSITLSWVFFNGNFTNGTKSRKVSHQGVLKIVGAEKSCTAFKKIQIINISLTKTDKVKKLS